MKKGNRCVKIPERNCRLKPISLTPGGRKVLVVETVPNSDLVRMKGVMGKRESNKFIKSRCK